jgi:hypothetical protein
MKAKAFFSQILRPKIVQYLIDNHGNSYDTVESIGNKWRLTYPVSDEIIDNILVQIKTIEKTHLSEQHYKSELYQELLSETIADHILRYVKRSETYKNHTKAEIKAILKKDIDISKNKKKEARFVVKRVTERFVYIADISESEKNITTDVENVLAHLYKYHALGSRRLFYRDTLGVISEIVHDNGVFLNFASNHMHEIEKPPAISPIP